jgi:hypothetical protein
MLALAFFMPPITFSKRNLLGNLVIHSTFHLDTGSPMQPLFSDGVSLWFNICQLEQEAVVVANLVPLFSCQHY